MVYIRYIHVASPNQFRIYQAVPSAQTDDVYDLSTPTPLLTDPHQDGPTGVHDIVFSTESPIASLVRVTALPPATTSPQAVLPKLPYHHQLNLLYLVPLFVALGVVVGAITAAVIFKWRENRRCLLRTSSLLPGPPYVPPENDVEDRLLVHGPPSMEEVSLFAAATPSKYTVHGSRYAPKQTFAWRTLDVTRPPQPTYSHTIIPSADGEKFTVIAEEDPFIATSPIAPGSSTDVPLPQIRLSPSLQAPTPGDHQHANLPKPFRRSMFDILKLKGPYRSTPSARKQYAVVAPEEEPALTSGVRRVNSLKTSHTSEHQAHTVRLSLSGDFNIGDMEDALGLLDLQGDTRGLADARVVSPEQAIRPQGGTLPTEAIQSEVESIVKHADIYTKAPQRRPSRASRKSTSSSRRFSAPDAHASVLPLSPPSLMSPPLEKSLFFTTSMSSSASLAGRATASPEISLFPLPSNKTSSTKKLRTKRPEPPLPYPSYPDLVHAQSSGPASAQEPSVSPGSPKPKGRSTSAAHRDSATGIWSLGSLSQTSLAIALASASSGSDVLSKVNDIVTLGYTKKRASVGGDEQDVANWADV